MRRRMTGLMTLDRTFLLWLLAVTVLTMVLVSVLVLRHERRFLEDQLEERGRHLARVIGEVVARQGVATALSMADVEDVLAVEVMDRHGGVVWRYGPLPGDIERVGTSVVRVEEEVKAPFAAVGEDPFLVVVQLSKGPMLRHLAASAARLLGGLYLALALSLVLGLWLITRVVRPIRELARRARAFEPDQPAAEAIPSGGGAEVAELGAAFSDMWSRLAAQRRALRASQAEKMEAIGTLAGGVAHDFNNLLAGILLHVRWLERDPGARREAAAAIKDLAEEGAEVIQELLVFSHRETTPMELVDVVALIHNQEPVLRHLLPPAVELRLVLAPAPTVVRANPVALRRLVLNLVLNARDAVAARGGHVEVRVEAGPEWATIEVLDDGDGIDLEHREHLFEPFFSLRREGRGAGLGLAVVYAVVSEHGGEIAVEAAPDRGTRITVRLPLCEVASGDSEEVAEADSPDQPGLRVLLLEADGLRAGRLMEQLAVGGFEPRHASTLAEASRQAGSFDPDAVVANLDLLKGSSASFLAELQRPAVLIVGRDGADRERPEGTESVAVLTEPVTAEELLKALRRLMDVT